MCSSTPSPGSPDKGRISVHARRDWLLGGAPHVEAADVYPKYEHENLVSVVSARIEGMACIVQFDQPLTCGDAGGVVRAGGL